MKSTIDLHLTADELQLVIDALTIVLIEHGKDGRISPATAKAMAKLKEELENEP